MGTGGISIGPAGQDMQETPLRPWDPYTRTRQRRGRGDACCELASKLSFQEPDSALGSALGPDSALVIRARQDGWGTPVSPLSWVLRNICMWSGAQMSPLASYVASGGVS